MDRMRRVSDQLADTSIDIIGGIGSLGSAFKPLGDLVKYGAEGACISMQAWRDTKVLQASLNGSINANRAAFTARKAAHELAVEEAAWNASIGSPTKVK